MDQFQRQHADLQRHGAGCLPDRLAGGLGDSGGHVGAVVDYVHADGECTTGLQR